MVPTELFSDGTLCVVDVTLRDGGYLNDWHFSETEMNAIVHAMDTAGIDITEVGYLGGSEREGLAAVCPVDVLARLARMCRRVKLAVMLRPRVSEARGLLEPRADHLALVRIPTAILDPQPAIECAKIATDLGITASLNLTNVTAFTEHQVLDVIETATRSNAPGCIYLADSRGAMIAEEVTSLVGKSRRVWKGRFGFHAHDNMGLAIENSIAAIEAGCDMIDGSLNGYGIGGQNTSLLELLRCLPDHGQNKKAGRLEPVAESVRLTMPAEGLDVYRLAGKKNIKQEWVPPLVERFGKRASSVLGALPQQPYQSIDEMWANIENTSTESLGH